MPLERIQLGIVLLCLLPGATLASAQARGYHIELTGRNTGIILVNDSHKTIEAFHVKAECGRSTGMESTYDALLWPGDKTPLFFVNGLQIQPQSDVIPPRGRMTWSFLLTPQPDACTWQAHIDAVIFSDGTYSGSRKVVQFMQAWREGFATSLRYWTDRMRAPGADGVRDEAKRRSQEDQSKDLDSDTPGGQYWQGRWHVDDTLAEITQPHGTDSARKAQLLQQYPSQMVNQWVSKLDDDTAFKRLNTVFPLRPEMLQPPPPPKISTPCKPSQHK